MKIRVLIAEDNASIRRWYQVSLQQAEDIELLPMAANGYEAISLAARHRPDVVVMDVEMERHDAGIIAGYQILALHPETKVIMLTVHEDDEAIFRAYEMGAVDYLFKDADTEKILGAIRDAYHGTSPIRQEIAQRMRAEFRRLKQSEHTLLQGMKMVQQLSSTERSIALMLLDGMSRSEICRCRVIEMSTLKTHIRSILQKFQLKSTRQLVAFVQTQNLRSFLELCDKEDQRRQGEKGPGSAEKGGRP